jgi:hypothetical protein
VKILDLERWIVHHMNVPHEVSVLALGQPRRIAKPVELSCAGIYEKAGGVRRAGG